ncbi:MAG: TadE family protein [Solirubrobacterales bacterium]
MNGCIRSIDCIGWLRGRRVSGSVTLEAAAVFPLVIALMLLLINFLRIGLAYAFIDHAAGEAAKQLAVYAYALNIVQAGTDNLEAAAEQKVPAVFQGELVQKALAGAREAGSQAALDTLATMLVDEEIDSRNWLEGVILPGSIECTRVRMANPWRADSERAPTGPEANPENVVVIVEYKLDLVVPFFSRRGLMITHTAVERAWMDDKIGGETS